MAGKPTRGAQLPLALTEALGAPPHFHGHRQRLRERLLAGGAENLPDYELMEVLLFAGNPRGDVKPLAKDLIERFGGFAEALSARLRRITLSFQFITLR
jgi:DNA repair protein RadC